MKKTIIIIILLTFLIPLNLYANKNMDFSIKRKISNYLSLIYNISNRYISYSIIDKNNLPNFELYDIKIMNEHNIELQEKVSFKIKISSFFNKNDYQIITIEVSLINFKNTSNKKVKLSKNDNITIFFNNKNIKFIDIGTIDKILDNDIIIVKNSFNHLLKCKLISNEIAEVIQ